MFPAPSLTCDENISDSECDINEITKYTRYFPKKIINENEGNSIGIITNLNFEDIETEIGEIIFLLKEIPKLFTTLKTIAQKSLEKDLVSYFCQDDIDTKIKFMISNFDDFVKNIEKLMKSQDKTNNLELISQIKENLDNLKIFFLEINSHVVNFKPETILPGSSPKKIKCQDATDEIATDPCIPLERYTFPSINPDKTENYSDFGLNNCELVKNIGNILQFTIGDVSPLFTAEDNKLIVYVKSVDYKNISLNKKLEIQSLIQGAVFQDLHQKYQKFKHDMLKVDRSQIHITAFTGSTYIIIEIKPPQNSNSLSEREAEMLNFYNFWRIIHGSQLPVKESDYLYNTVPKDNSSLYDAVNQTFSTFHENYHHLQQHQGSYHRGQHHLISDHTKKQAPETTLPSIIAPAPTANLMQNAIFDTNTAFPAPSPVSSIQLATVPTETGPAPSPK